MSWNQEEEKSFTAAAARASISFFFSESVREKFLASHLSWGERKKMRKRVTKIPVSSSPWRNRWKHMREREGQKIKQKLLKTKMWFVC